MHKARHLGDFWCSCAIVSTVAHACAMCSSVQALCTDHMRHVCQENKLITAHVDGAKGCTARPMSAPNAWSTNSHLPNLTYKHIPSMEGLTCSVADQRASHAAHAVHQHLKEHQSMAAGATTVPGPQKSDYDADMKPIECGSVRWSSQGCRSVTSASALPTRQHGTSSRIPS